MNQRQAELYRRIREFKFSSPHDARPFERRLAEEQGWTDAFTARAIEEYCRYVLLACTSQQVVCPSEVVDAVWHLHLLYTRSYWREFCDGVLQQPLDHEPSRGGAVQLDRHVNMYQATLDAYQATFEQPPPADIWPPAKVRFAARPVLVPVDREAYWLIPKPGWFRQLSRHHIWLAAGLLFVPALRPPLGAIAEPYNLSGPDFLTLFLCLVVIVFMVGFALRTVARYVDSRPDDPAPLTPYETAYLSGGSGRAINAAVARLIQAKAITLKRRQPPEFEISTGAKIPNDELERTICAACTAPQGVRLSTIHRAARPLMPAIHDKLRQQKLLTSTAANVLGRATPLLIVAAVLLFAAGKLYVGLQRERPVALLVLACIATAVAGLIAFGRPLFRTPHGDQYLTGLRFQHGNLRASAIKEPELLSPQQVAMAAGLWGCGLLGTTAYGNTLGQREGWAGLYGGGCGNRAASSGSGCGASGCGGGGGGCGGGCGGCS